MSIVTGNIQQCANCGAVVSFSNPRSSLIVCKSCGSVLTRHGTSNQVAKSITTPPTQKSSVQVGTSGNYNEKEFAVIGRIMTWHEESVFNYWSIEWSDKSLGILAEGYGLYYIMLEKEAQSPEIFFGSKKVEVGKYIELMRDSRFIVEKKLKVIRWHVEGEVFLNQQPREFTIIDFAQNSKVKVTIFDFGDDQFTVYNSFPVDYTQLSFSNLRQDPDEPLHIECVQCGSPVILKTFPYAQSFSCQNCHTYHSYSEKGIFKPGEKVLSRTEPDLPIGSKGEINGTLYEVIGFAVKEETNIYHSNWREYTLYENQQGFAFLSEYDGHWTFLKERTNSPYLDNANNKKTWFENTEFLLYNSYHYIVLDAIGEFPYDLFDNGHTECHEFINPPLIWVREVDRHDGIKWFLGRHISPGEIKRIFGIVNLRYRVGIGAVQPGSINPVQFFKVVFIGLLVLLFVHFFTTYNNRNELLHRGTYTFSDTSNSIIAVTEKYVLDERRSNLELEIFAGVQNSWVELTATLINANTGEERTVEKGVEYYSGYSDGETWSEGSTTNNVYFTNIPRGTYFLQLNATREPIFSSDGPIPGVYNGVREFNLDITYDVTSERNLWFSLLFFIIWPVGMYLRSRYVESERWRNSPFSNYHNED